MNRFVCLAAGLGLFAVALAAVRPAGAQGTKDPDVKDIMAKSHKGPSSLLPAIGGKLKADVPAWDEVLKASKEYAAGAEALGKNAPPKGDKASWDAYTRAYLATARELEQAATTRNKPAAQAAHGKLTTSCKGCHAAHKG